MLKICAEFHENLTCTFPEFTTAITSPRTKEPPNEQTNEPTNKQTNKQTNKHSRSQQLL